LYFFTPFARDPHQRFVGKKVPPKENLEDRGLGRALEFRIFNFNFAYQDGSTRGVLTVRTGDNTIYGGKPPYADKCCIRGIPRLSRI